VLLSDLGMPGMGGYDLIRHVRQDLGLGPAELPAAAVTAYVRATDREAALQAGFQRCLPKAVSPHLLARAVAELALTRRPAATEELNLRVLFVEDNDDLREQIVYLLEEVGLQPESCATAEEALALYSPERFDLVLTDVSLPQMSGIDLARNILRGAPEAWVVFSSGYAMGSDLSDFGPNVRALLKPFDLPDLQLLLAEIRQQRGG